MNPQRRYRERTPVRHSPAPWRMGGWGLVVCLLVASGLAQGQTKASSQSTASPLLAKPIPAKRAELPEVFRQETPSSLGDLKAIEKRVTSLLARLSSAVVSVEVGWSSGSGVVISEDGLVLSAAHVCGEPGRNVTFTFPDGKTARGKTLGTNHELDTGLMRITGSGPWPHVAMGELDEARLGDWVLALGHPGGYDSQRPLVARLGRIIRLTPNRLQTDCTLIMGDSGGPLFDMSGRVIGIHSFISASTEGNFHVAIGTYESHWERLAQGDNWGSRRPSRPFVGATSVDDPEGCRLEQVDENGPAAKAGLKVGDIILKADQQPIKDASAFRQCIGHASPGDLIAFEIKRGDEQKTVSVTVGTRRGRGRFGP